MSARCADYVNLLDLLTKDLELPPTYDRWGIKSVRPDLRTYNDYRWPFPGNETERFKLDDHNSSSCPLRPGDGLCVATDWAGMASGGYPARTLLLVAYRANEARGDQNGKLRTAQCFVVDLIDGESFLIKNGKGANLGAAYLGAMDLRNADLRDAYLRDANLRNSNLRDAYLGNANLQNANLGNANLGNANLRDAYLRDTYLRNAYLRGAYLEGQDVNDLKARGAIV